VEGNDKCVVDMRVEFDGIPYSDAFAVQVRWVARREHQNDIAVEVGVFVDFKKSTFLKNKIKSGTIEETTPVHKNLFENVKAACLAAGEGDAVEESNEVEESLRDINEEQSVVSNNSKLMIDLSFLNNLSFDRKITVVCATMVVFIMVIRLLTWTKEYYIIIKIHI
jgi:hypothetical protein